MDSRATHGDARSRRNRMIPMRAGAIAIALVAAAATAHGHDGPPFPILSDHAAGPYVISIWTDPDTTDDGSPGGQFWVRLHVAGKGAVIPAGTRVMVGIKPHGCRRASARRCHQSVRGTDNGPRGPLCGPRRDRRAAWRCDGGRRSRRHLQRSALAVDAGALPRAVPAHRTVMGTAAVAAATPLDNRGFRL